MQAFHLKSDGSVVAYICEFPDGETVVRWRGPNGTTVVHDSIESVRAIHVEGHEGRSVESAEAPEVGVVYHAISNAIQDECENAPWGSIDGDRFKVKDPEWRPSTPAWIDAKYGAVYLAAYLTRIPLGTEFGWALALTVGNEPQCPTCDGRMMDSGPSRTGERYYCFECENAKHGDA